MGKSEVGLAFDGGNNQSAVTKEYAARRKLKKVGFTVPVIGFGSPEPEMGELFEVPLRTSGKKEVIIQTVAVEAIHPENIATSSCSPGAQNPGTWIRLGDPLMSAWG
jgi:hypothetical protein